MDDSIWAARGEGEGLYWKMEEKCSPTWEGLQQIRVPSWQNLRRRRQTLRQIGQHSLPPH